MTKALRRFDAAQELTNLSVEMTGFYLAMEAMEEQFHMKDVEHDMEGREGYYISFARKMLGVFCEDVENLADAAWAAGRRSHERVQRI